MLYFFSWIILSFVAGSVGATRKIGFLSTFFVSLVLSPLVGFIVAFNSDKVPDGPPASPVMLRLIADGDRYVKAAKYDEALDVYTRSLAFTDKAPDTHFKIARIYSIQRDTSKSIHHLSLAIDSGYKDFDKINSDSFLSYLRNQDEFKTFVANGYKSPSSAQDYNSKSKLDELQQLADLFERGVLTKAEFEKEKVRILGE